MIYLVIAITAFFASGITLFSGFGLATVLTPVFILFFPAPVAVGLTAIVHFLNNIFKFFLLGKHGNKEVLIKFGIPAVFAAILGGLTLSLMAKRNFIISYSLFNHKLSVEFINFVIGFIILFFVFVEVLSDRSKISFNKKFLFLGGLLSGFFGGLSGNQGAFRSIFLLKCNLSKEEFIATGVIIACLVDFARIFVYGVNFFSKDLLNDFPLLFVAIFSAFSGSYFSKKYLHKVTIGSVRIIVLVMLLGISTGMITGLI